MADPNVPINPPGGPTFTQRLWSEEVAIARAVDGDSIDTRDPSYEFSNGRKFVEPASRIWDEGNIAPISTFAPVITGASYDGATLTCTTGSWSARPDPTYSYQWKSGATNVGTDQNAYISQVGDIGSAITCTVTATNYEGSSSRESNAITVTASASPSNTVAPVVSGSQPAGSTLSSTIGTWAANPSVSSYSYQWKADSGNVGTNQATYVTQVGDVGKSITCTVTATNVKGSGSQASNGVTVTAALAAPANTVAPVVSGDSASGSTLTSTTGTWTGNPTPTYAYQWKSDGSNVGSNQNTYVTEYGDVGKSVTCTVTATNSQGNSSQASNGITVTVSNPNAVIEALFANSEVGAWYDPSDLTTMFQDSAGTTPVTADGQPVGLILDKSKGMVLGSEISPAISTWTAGANVSISGETIVFSAAGMNNSAYFYYAAGSIKTYQITFRIVSISSGSITPTVGDTFVSTPFTTAGTYTVRMRGDGNGYFQIQSKGSPTNAVVDSVSIKELTGNHAVTPSDATRPLKTSTGLSDWINYDAVDDVLNITFQSSLGSSCTVCRANVGAAPTILTAQTIGTSYADSTDHAGLIIINRALTGQETTDVTAWLLAKGATA